MPALVAVTLLLTWTNRGDGAASLSAPGPGERIAIVAPHPDDEVLGTGGLIQQAIANGATVHVIYLTNGEHNQAAFRRFSQRSHLADSNSLALGEQRRTEALAAARCLGLTPADLTFLGYPDWCTMHLWQDCWSAHDSFFYGTTQTNAVPYPEDFGYRHEYRPENITADLCAVLRKFRPTRVFVTHPCDTNPDHRAAANFVRLALLELETEGLRPALAFYLVHFGNWPNPARYEPDASLKPPLALSHGAYWMSLPLTLPQTRREDAATLTNLTQVADHRGFLESFARANEVFAAITPPLIPALPAQGPLDWSRAVRTPVLSVLPAEYGYEPNGIASLSASPSLMDLASIDFLRQNDTLVAQLDLQHPTGQPTGVELNLFGYRRGSDFAGLPKVRIAVSPQRRLTVTINGQPVDPRGVTLTNDGMRLILRVPLMVLGGANLDHVFIAARATLGGVDADDTAWQLLQFQTGPGKVATREISTAHLRE